VTANAKMASWIAEAKSGSLPLYPTRMGTPDTEQWFGNSLVELSVRNVTSPTITPFLPDAGKTNGAAVVIVPGGGKYFVSLRNEGIPVARWLAERGVAAFVVKYRSVPTPRDEAGFAAYPCSTKSSC
jgi:acetyl esterase/lipase